MKNVVISATVLGTAAIGGYTVVKTAKYLAGASLLSILLTVGYVAKLGVGFFESQDERTIRYRMMEMQARRDEKIQQREFDAIQMEAQRKHNLEIKRLEAEKKVSLNTTLTEFVEDISKKKELAQTELEAERREVSNNIFLARREYEMTAELLRRQQDRDRQLWNREIATHVGEVKALRQKAALTANASTYRYYSNKKQEHLTGF